MRSPSNTIASSVRNIGAVKLIAVKSASGIIVSAVNQQNMLAVPDNERSACDAVWPCATLADLRRAKR